MSGEQTKGTLIGLWSLRHRSGTSSLAVLEAFDLSKVTSSSILLLDTNFYSDIVRMLDIKSDKTLDTMINLLEIKELTTDNFKSNTVEVNERLSVLPGTSITQLDYLSGKEKEISTIIEMALEVYDIVIADCNSGLLNMLSAILLDRSDILINVLEQDSLLLNDFSFKYAEVRQDILSKPNVINVVNKYSSSIYPNLQELEKSTDYDDLLAVDYSEDLRSAYNNFNLQKYVEGNSEQTLNQVREITKRVISTGLISGEILDKSATNKKSKIFSIFKRK